MQRYGLFLLLAALLVGSCSAYSSVTLSSIQPQKLTVNVTYKIDGQKESYPICSQQAPGSECLPKPHAIRDQVMVSYAVMPQYMPNTSDTVLLKACYSPFSRVNRPWRALNNVIALSKACPFIIAKGLNSTAGNATWTIPQNTPTATYFIRALVYGKNATDPSSPPAVAIGDSQGYFQVIPISDREYGLVVASGICICVGPLLFTAFMLWEFKFKKV